MELIAATTNAHKRAELSRLLAKAGVTVHPLPDHTDYRVDESGATLAENAQLKAQGFARHLNDWVIADDTGLEVAALKGAPGVRTARYAGDNASMAENLEKLLTELQEFEQRQRQARFVCVLAVAAPDGSLWATAQGSCYGRVLLHRRGDGGFGYDSLFELIEYRRTLAELGPTATDVLGHRGVAARQMLRRLAELRSIPGRSTC